MTLKNYLLNKTLKNNPEELSHTRAYLNRSRYLYMTNVDRNPAVLIMSLDEAFDRHAKEIKIDAEMPKL